MTLELQPYGSDLGADLRLLAGPPERILIYHGGTGNTMFLGMLRLTTIFVFGASCLLVAPAFASDEYPSYLAPAGKFLLVNFSLRNTS